MNSNLPETMLAEISRVVTGEMANRNLSAERLGNMIGVDPRAILKIQDGKRVYSDALAQVLSALDLTVMPRRLVDTYCDIADNPYRVLFMLILTEFSSNLDRKDLTYIREIIDKKLS